MKKNLGFIFIVLLFQACGVYNPAPVVLPSHIRSISISPVINNTPIYGLEDELTRTIKDEFIRDGRIPINNDIESDGDVETVISRYILEPLSYDENHVIEEYKLWVLVDLRFIDRVRNKILWEERNLEGDHRFFVDTKPGGLTEDEAREFVWDNLSRNIIKRTIEGFGSVTGLSDKRAPQSISEE
ncbi:MAG: LptE family protein [bacterium]